LNRSTGWFQRVVDRLDGDAYDKTFASWDHLVALIYAQLGGIDGLRGLEASFNANAHHHYHLGVGAIARSTLSDANARRPVGVFAATFTMLAAGADRQMRREGATMVRLIDASPIPLGAACTWSKGNGRFRGMKLHVVYDPMMQIPHAVEVSAANVNDVEVGRRVRIAAGTTSLSSSRARRATCACAPRGPGLWPNAPATRSRSCRTPRSCSRAGAMRACRSRCGASGSSATPEARSPC
jgi:hypothetical protein